MKYRISKAAYNDLNEIYAYTFAEWSEHQAEKYFESIIEQIGLLSRNPKRKRHATKIKPDIFYFRAMSHYVFYKITEDEIEVIRILHKMMEFSDHLE